MGIDALGFRRLRKGEQRRWQGPTSFEFLETVGFAPVSGTELLNLSHHLPVLVSLNDAGASVVAALTSSWLRQPLVGEGGRWLRPYMPLALRCLPFRLEVSDNEKPERSAILLTEALGAAPDGEGHPLLDDADALSSQATEIAATLIRAHTSEQQLAAAAELLVLADLLTPVDGPAGKEEGVLYTADVSRMPSLSGQRASVLVRDGFMPMHLLIALLFSRRLLSPNIQVRERQAHAREASSTERTMEDFAFASLAPLNFALDDSDLVPVDLFE